MELPVMKADELFLVEWIYPTHDWSFPLRQSQQSIRFHRVPTSDHQGPPKHLDLETEWQVHFRRRLKQTQAIIDFYEEELRSVTRIRLAPHGTQWQTPFGALKHPTTREPLLATHELLLVPSLRYCTIADARTRTHNGRFLVLGDPTEDLPGACLEAESVARTLGCTPIMGKAVTKRRVLGMLADERPLEVLHFAGHGHYDRTGLQGLVLADGLLTSQELQPLRLEVNVCCLMGCWTGMVAWDVWNELHGFVRTLLVSGTRNVISSAYPVSDSFARGLAERFYPAYLRTREPGRAFQTAFREAERPEEETKWGGAYIAGQR